MELKQGYKQTDIGVIPSDWSVDDLDHLGTTNRPAVKAGPFGSSLKKEFYVKEGYKIYGQEQVISGDPYFGDYYIDKERFRLLRSCEVITGDLLISLVGTLGKILIVPQDAERGIINPRLLRLSFDSLKVNVEYASYWLTSNKVNVFLQQYAQGGTMGVLNASILSSLLFPLPSLPEQRAIAAALSDVDALLAALDAFIAKKRLVKQGAMQELLTGKRKLPGFTKLQGYKRTEIGFFPKDWDIVPLKSISSMHGRIGWQGLKQSEFTMNSDDPFLITGMNFKDGEIRWGDVYHIPNARYEIAKEIQLRPNDVLMTKDGTIGKILYVDQIPYPGKASLNSHLLVFRPLNNKYIPKFLFYQLNSKTFHNHIEQEKSGTTFFGITQEAVGKYNAFLPSIPEQTAIAEILSDMDAEIAALEQRREKTRLLKQGMMQELLTGRIRLV